MPIVDITEIDVTEGEAIHRIKNFMENHREWNSVV